MLQGYIVEGSFLHIYFVKVYVHQLSWLIVKHIVGYNLKLAKIQMRHKKLGDCKVRYFLDIDDLVKSRWTPLVPRVIHFSGLTQNYLSLKSDRYIAKVLSGNRERKF